MTARQLPSTVRFDVLASILWDGRRDWQCVTWCAYLIAGVNVDDRPENTVVTPDVAKRETLLLFDVLIRHRLACLVDGPWPTSPVWFDQPPTKNLERIWDATPQSTFILNQPWLALTAAGRDVTVPDFDRPHVDNWEDTLAACGVSTGVSDLNLQLAVPFFAVPGPNLRPENGYGTALKTLDDGTVVGKRQDGLNTTTIDVWYPDGAHDKVHSGSVDDDM